jgi:hypothetical protein
MFEPELQEGDPQAVILLFQGSLQSHTLLFDFFKFIKNKTQPDVIVQAVPAGKAHTGLEFILLSSGLFCSAAASIPPGKTWPC